MSDEAAERRFRSHYNQHYRALLAYGLRRCRDERDAHDAVAEAFAVMWRRRRDVPALEAEVVLWLFGIMRRVIANQERSQARRERLVSRLIESEAQHHAARGVAEEGAPSIATVMQALSSLDERDREILLLAAWEGRSTAEIAAILKCSENAAALRLHRARQRLTKVYEKENNEAGHKESEEPSMRPPADHEES